MDHKWINGETRAIVTELEALQEAQEKETLWIRQLQIEAEDTKEELRTIRKLLNELVTQSAYIAGYTELLTILGRSKTETETGTGKRNDRKKKNI